MSLIRLPNSQARDYPLDPYNDLVPPGTVTLDELKTNDELIKRRYFSISLEDIDTYQKEKVKNWIKVYEKVLGDCYRRIRDHVLHDQTFCFFSVPEYIPGFPIFNLTHCTCFIMRKLRQAKFSVQYFPPNILYISWPLERQSLQMIAPPPPPVATPSAIRLTDEKPVFLRYPPSQLARPAPVAPVAPPMPPAPQQKQETASSTLNRSSRANWFAQQEEDTFLFSK